MERLNPRVRIVWVVSSLIRGVVTGLLLVGGTVAVYTSGVWVGMPVTLVWVALGLSIAWAIFTTVVAWLRYGVWRFEVQADALYIERGVFTRIKTVVPFVRVQHVDSSRGPLERIVGLATVVVYTAGSRSADVAVPGLLPNRAEHLREQLRELAIESEGEDAV